MGPISAQEYDVPNAIYNYHTLAYSLYYKLRRFRHISYLTMCMIQNLLELAL
jgi:hypothetical protein